MQTRCRHKRRKSGLRHDRRCAGWRHRRPAALQLRPQSDRTSAGDCGTFTESEPPSPRHLGRTEAPRRQLPLVWTHARASFGGLSAPNPATPNPITLEWWRFFLDQNPQWDWHTLTRESYENYWTQSTEEFSAVIATDNPDITAFRDRGGKLILWHGLADQLIYPQGTMDY